jgi:hypothetical protein
MTGIHQGPEAARGVNGGAMIAMLAANIRTRIPLACGAGAAKLPARDAPPFGGAPVCLHLWKRRRRET